MTQPIEPLWNAADLAKFMGFAESTVARMVTMQPHRLPPRVAGAGHRWVPEVCRQWAIKQSGGAPATPVKRGRSRKVQAA